MMISLFKCPQDNDKIAQIMERIEYTALLSLNSTDEDVKKVCEDAKHYKMARIVPFQTYIKDVFRYLEGSDVKVVQGCCDIFSRPQRLHIVEEGLKLGCCEVDIVGQQALFLDKRYDEYQDDIRACVEIANRYNAPLKVIIETGFLSDEEKILMSRLSLEAGATFIKTCMGMRGGRCSMHDILLLKDAFGDDIKIKASGSVASLEDAYAMIQAGADRVAIRGLAVDQMREIGYMPE
jgi:deoxyribose-phosphate aldolase